MRPLVLALMLVLALSCPGIAGAEATGGWREEFANICARSNEAATYGEAELVKLIADCERLRQEIAASKEPDSRVYLFRLDKCRNFLLFMKETAGQR